MLISNLSWLSSRGCCRSNNGIRRSWIMPQLRFTVDWLSACAEARAVCLRLPSKNAHTLDHPHRNCEIKYIQVNIYLKLKCWISTQSKVMTSSGNKLEIRKIVVLLQPAVCRPTIYWTIWAMWIKNFPFLSTHHTTTIKSNIILCKNSCNYLTCKKKVRLCGGCCLNWNLHYLSRYMFLLALHTDLKQLTVIKLS